MKKQKKLKHVKVFDVEMIHQSWQSLGLTWRIVGNRRMSVWCPALTVWTQRLTGHLMFSHHLVWICFTSHHAASSASLNVISDVCSEENFVNTSCHFVKHEESFTCRWSQMSHVTTINTFIISRCFSHENLSDPLTANVWMTDVLSVSQRERHHLLSLHFKSLFQFWLRH